MAVRMTGMISGMDTDSLIKELVNAQRLKNKKVSDKLVKSEWKEEKWKELNTKLYKLYTSELDKVKLQGNYLTKKVSTTNDALVSVKGSKDAPEGAHTLTIDKLASSQYVTGDKLGTDKNGKEVTTSTKLSDLGMTSSNGKDMIVTIKNGTKEKQLIVTDNTTLDNFLSACKEAGLNASYDKTQKRIFVSSKESGAASAFSITTGEISSDATSALNDIKSLVNYAGLSTTVKGEVDAAVKTLEGLSSAELTDLNDKAMNGTAGADSAEQKKIDAIKTLRDYAIKKAETDLKASSVKQVKESIKSNFISGQGEPDAIALEALKTEIENEIAAGTLPGSTDVEAAAIERFKKNEAVLDDIKAKTQEKIDGGKFTLPEGKTLDEYASDVVVTMVQKDRDAYFNDMVEKEYSGNSIYKSEADLIYNTGIDAYKNSILTGADGLLTNIATYSENSGVSDKPGASNLTLLGLDEITGKEEDLDLSKVKVVLASDSEITLDGAKLTGTTNTINANGLTISITGKTAVGETISLDVANNTEANYEMVKNFIKTYNEILGEMNKLYYADSSRGYDPLSDEEKEAMTDDQIEKWESKIKDSSLRRDTTLDSLLSSMKSAMMSSVKVDGKSYSLATYGITTSTDYTEKGLLHIYGDKDDSVYSTQSDKLMKALSEDPDTVVTVLTEVAKNLYSALDSKMKSIPNVSSTNTAYNDKLLDKEQTDYKKRIAVLEKKLTEMENKYYKQFSAMETALAKLQSQSNALAGLMGTNS